jgi:hypothetical protein
MKKFKVLLTKAYEVTITAENEEKAKRYSELFTSDIINLSNEEDLKSNLFRIEDIECKMNEAFEVEKME